MNPKTMILRGVLSILKFFLTNIKWYCEILHKLKFQYNGRIRMPQCVSTGEGRSSMRCFHICLGNVLRPISLLDIKDDKAAATQSSKKRRWSEGGDFHDGKSQKTKSSALKVP